MPIQKFQQQVFQPIKIHCLRFRSNIQRVVPQIFYASFSKILFSKPVVFFLAGGFITGFHFSFHFQVLIVINTPHQTWTPKFYLWCSETMGIGEVDFAEQFSVNDFLPSTSPQLRLILFISLPLMFKAGDIFMKNY